MRINSMRQLIPAILFLTATICAAPGEIVNAIKAGAVGDGATLNTAAIQKAVDACSADGGGTVQFPPGRFVTGTIQLKDNVTLRLDENAVLLGSTNAADFRNLDPFMAGDGVPLGYALIVAAGAKHAGIEGGGTIDGQGRELRAAQTRFTVRPFLMRWLHCTNVTVKDVHLANPGAWTLNFFQSYDATVERVTIRTRNTGLANNDGIDLDSCEKVSILDCDIESGDDALCLKTTSPLPCRNITASGCKLSTKCNAIKLGTESLGDFENISVTNCQIRNTGIKDMHVTGARQIGLLINGITNHPVENLTLENIQIELAGGGKLSDAQIQLPEKESSYPEYSMFGKVMPAYVLFAWHVRGITFKNVQTTVTQSDARPATIFVDVEGAIPADFATSSHPTKQ